MHEHISFWCFPTQQLLSKFTQNYLRCLDDDWFSFNWCHGLDFQWSRPWDGVQRAICLLGCVFFLEQVPVERRGKKQEPEGEVTLKCRPMLASIDHTGFGSRMAFQIIPHCASMPRSSQPCTDLLFYFVLLYITSNWRNWDGKQK